MRIATFVLASWMASVAIAGEAVTAPQFYSSLNSHTFSETTSIDSLLHDFDGDIRSGERAFTFNRLEAGLRYGWLSLGVVQRYDYFLRFDNDVARAYHASAHDKTLPAGQNNDVFIRANHIRARGTTLGLHLEPLEQLKVSVTLAHLWADSMADGVARGELALSGTNQYSGAVDFRLHSSEDLLLEMPVPDPAGKGYAADVAIDWQLSEQWQLALQVQDIYSRIEWDDVLYSDLHANTATVSYDGSGRLHTSPVMYGYQYLDHTRQELPRKYHGRATYNLTARHSLYVQQFYVPEYVSQSVLGYESGSDQWRIGGYWNVHSRAVGMTGQWQWLSWRLGADSNHSRQARALDLMLGLQIPLHW